MVHKTDPSFTFQSKQGTGIYLGSAGIAFTVDGVYAGILLEDGSATVSSNGIITREKGDLRYTRATRIADVLDAMADLIETAAPAPLVDGALPAIGVQSKMDALRAMINEIRNPEPEPDDIVEL